MGDGKRASGCQDSQTDLIARERIDAEARVAEVERKRREDEAAAKGRLGESRGRRA
jgi:hypothetical protein